MKEKCNQFVSDNCSCANQMPYNMDPEYTPFIEDSMELAQAYVPFQSYTAPMSQAQSLICGTIFPDLVVPYCSGWHLFQLSKEV